MLFSAIQSWLKSVCNCDISQQHSIICFDNTTANITIVFQSHGNYTAQAMIDLVVNYIQRQNHSVVHLQSGLTVCLNTDCEWKLDNPNITMGNDSTPAVDESDNFLPLIVGLITGILFVAVVASLLCIIAMFRKIHKPRLVHDQYMAANTV